jgi:hypothetical protein
VLRRNPGTAFIPIVAVGGAVEDLGGIPLLLRPVPPEQLLALAHRYLPAASDHDGCV